MSRILLADDDALQLDLRKHLLEIAGYQVEVALSRAQALRILGRTAGIDLVILDLRFPNGLGEPDAREGMALIRDIRDLSRQVPLIVLSGWPEELYGQPEEQLVSSILLKPVKTRELLHIVSGLLAVASS
jgi:CheY-like chemotaxis protein